LTKICPKCNSENQDTNDFCQNCGQDIGRIANTFTQTPQSGANSWWNKQSKGGKVAIGVGACCIGIILLAIIGGMLVPDSTTTTNTTKPSEKPSSKENKTTSDTVPNKSKKTDTAGLTRIEILEYTETGFDGPKGIDATITTENGPYFIDRKVDMEVWKIYHGGNDPFLAKVEVRDAPPFKNVKVIVGVYDLNGNKLS
jgi:hypothetical protein